MRKHLQDFNRVKEISVSMLASKCLEVIRGYLSFEKVGPHLTGASWSSIGECWV